MLQFDSKYDFSALESYNLEEIRKQIEQNSKNLEESIEELKELTYGT